MSRPGRLRQGEKRLSDENVRRLWSVVGKRSTKTASASLHLGESTLVKLLSGQPVRADSCERIETLLSEAFNG
jgi:hypothetical protein